MEELYFENLGNFSEKDCKNIKKMMDGSTFYNYVVGWSNWAGNCSLIVKADCCKQDKEEAKGMFLYAAISKGATAFNMADFLVRYGNAHIKENEWDEPLVCEKKGDLLFFYFQDSQIAKTLCDNYHEFVDEYGRITVSVSQEEMNIILGSEAKREGYRLVVLK